MSWVVLLAAASSALVATALAMALVRRALIRHDVMDQPNPRSSHAAPTPRGGGIALVAVLLAAWLALWLSGVTAIDAPGLWLALAAAAGLGLISWLDDVRGGLSPLIRLAGQAAAVAAGLFALPGEGLIFQGALPLALDWALTGLVWLWFINLFNFMDGIDGIAGSEAAALGVGVFLAGLLAAAGQGLAPFGLALAAAAAGFLIWNWQPAKVFLGDVGSVPLGYLLGWLLVGLAAQGLWQAALILPAYYVADATTTLVRRLLRGERVWRAHREHCYQLAVRAGRSHAQVVATISLANCGLIGLALATLANAWAGWAALAAAAVLVAFLLWYLRRAYTGPSNAD